MAPAGRTVVFLGSSLSVEKAQTILQADYQPPVRRGDIDALRTNPPAVIGIVDGAFFQNFAISTKEILRAIDNGVRVFGASSMGALRAAELHSFGMIGVGKIFELYRSGRIEADDEVAMVYSPDDLRPLSVPLINIRFALQRAVELGVIEDPVRRTLVRAARRLYFPDRTYEHLLKIASDRIPEPERACLRDFLVNRAPDLKQEDALAMLAEIGKHLAGGT